MNFIKLLAFCMYFARINVTEGDIMNLKFLTFILAMLLCVQTAFAAPFSAKAKTKRIPAGTKFSLQMISQVSTLNSQGQDFSAILITDQTADSDVILPMGSLVRGNIKMVKPARRFSRGAVLYLDFDHIVTPNGRQLPLALSMVARADMSIDGGLVNNATYKDAVVENWDKTKDITTNSVEWGNDIAEDFAGGYFRILTVPLAAIGGGLAGGAYYVGDGVADMFRRGKEYYLQKGQVLDVILTQPIDVPVL